MKTYRDSDQAELNHLLAACNLAGKLVLEIGCADGKFTRQYANMAARVIVIDPETSDLRSAIIEKTALPQQLHYIQAIGESLPFPS